MGRELNDVARGRGRLGREIVRVGLVPSIPKSLAYQLTRPALEQEQLTVFIRQDTSAVLLDALVTGRLNVVLMNEVPAPPAGTRLQSHALGETEILLYARASLAKRAKRGFPKRLSDVPFVMPQAGTPLRKRLDEWLVRHGQRPIVKAEVDDAGLLRLLGARGYGVFPVRAALKTEAEDLRDVQLVGRCEGVRESYYAVTMDRRIRHAAVAAIVAAARGALHAVSTH
jgi:LysR family transcriptional activator of nhaA